MADLSELVVRLSGGASNTTPVNSIGGVMSTVSGGILLSQLAMASASPISGVALGDATGNAVGNGTLTFTYSATAPKLAWTPPSGAIGAAVDVSVAGTYALRGASNGGTLNVTVTPASFPGANKTDTIAITMQDQKLFDDVTKAEANTGVNHYRCVYLANAGTVASVDEKLNVEIWLESDTPGEDIISIGLATQGPNTGGATGVAGTDFPAAVASETTAPAGVTFSKPTSAAPLTAFDLSVAGGATFAQALWIKREVPAGVTASKIANSARIGIRAKG